MLKWQLRTKTHCSSELKLNIKFEKRKSKVFLCRSEVILLLLSSWSPKNLRCKNNEENNRKIFRFSRKIRIRIKYASRGRVPACSPLPTLLWILRTFFNTNWYKKLKIGIFSYLQGLVSPGNFKIFSRFFVLVNIFHFVPEK